MKKKQFSFLIVCFLLCGALMISTKRTTVINDELLLLNVEALSSRSADTSKENTKCNVGGNIRCPEGGLANLVGRYNFDNREYYMY